ncbi:hypothetical protein BY996DRAFT_6968016 [Phakopsora pachyrhizi]|uniref:Large ribosomal subunit protein mL46 N-terminal domain-containing protein n=1 Tax=Phakopsora pachyrhizi TaxID=170000 RepID=A0AAV0BEB1_PHAPC|nr:hypothetical protein BY996DRAFT_6968016 [Phakopsora pachyrhizi]CAH7684763.1 hypothetical protein PPACK8108_LOCUS19185 [Phakopsora pachyrhizi]
MRSKKIVMGLISDQRLLQTKLSSFKHHHSLPITPREKYSTTANLNPSLNESTVSIPAANQSNHKTSERSSDRRTLAVASLISRSPLILPKLTTFESAYYRYQNLLSQTLSKPINSSFFFRPGSIAANNYEKSRLKPSQVGFDEEQEIRRDQISKHLQDDLKSLERLPDQTLYLLLLKKSNKHWQLPQNKISSADNSLSDTAIKTTHLELGPHLDIWSISRFPAAVYQPTKSIVPEFKSIWIMPQRILRGQVDLSLSRLGNETSEFGWLSSKEIKGRVTGELWATLEPILNP